MDGCPCGRHTKIWGVLVETQIRKCVVVDDKGRVLWRVKKSGEIFLQSPFNVEYVECQMSVLQSHVRGCSWPHARLSLRVCLCLTVSSLFENNYGHFHNNPIWSAYLSSTADQTNNVVTVSHRFRLLKGYLDIYRSEFRCHFWLNSGTGRAQHRGPREHSRRESNAHSTLTLDA